MEEGHIGSLLSEKQFVIKKFIFLWGYGSWYVACALVGGSVPM